MKMTRRSFIGSSAAATAFAAVGAPAARPGDGVRYIDVHAHCVERPTCPLTRGGLQPICTPDQLLRHYDECGVEKGCILPLDACESFIGGQSNEEVLRICRSHPDRFVPFVNVDPRANGNSSFTDFLPVLEYYKAQGCRGLGEMFANIPFLDPRVQNLFAAAEKADLPVTFHVAGAEGWLYGLVDEPGLPQLETCLARFPKLRFFGHAQAFWSEIGEYTTFDERVGFPKGPVRNGRLEVLFRKYPNLYGDLSAGSGNLALARDRAYAAKFLTEFQDRLLFGLDICAPQGWRSELWMFLRDLVEKGDISETVFRKVARENQIRLLKLS